MVDYKTREKVKLLEFQIAWKIRPLGSNKIDARAHP